MRHVQPKRSRSATGLREEKALRRRIESELHTWIELNDGVLDTAAALIIVRDSAGKILRFNRACELASGYTFGEVHNRTIYDWHRAETDVLRTKCAYARLGVAGTAVRYENQWRHRDGTERTISWSLSGIYDATGKLKFTIASGIDVTEERHAQVLAARYHEELLQLYRVHTAGGLAASLAHELNQPLAAAIAYCETGLNRLRSAADAPGAAGEIGKAVKQVHRAAALIRELRTFLTQGGATFNDRVDLSAVVGAVRELVEPRACAGAVALRVAIEPNLPQISGNRVQLEQLLLALVTNAIEAFPESGTANACVVIGLRRDDNGGLRLAVTDNGAGVPGEVMRGMFDAFYSTKANGLGMGLKICRSIVEAHGGRIWAEQADGRGTAFQVSLPSSI